MDLLAILCGHGPLRKESLHPVVTTVSSLLTKSENSVVFSTSNHNEDAAPSTYWPRDLVPATLPHARIMTYGYDTHIKHWLKAPASSNTIYDIAWNLLIGLKAERRTDPLRPVLFVSHSLGGVITKELLRRSGTCQGGQAHLHGIFDSKVGIMFFGTPHAGADPRGFLQRIAEKAIKAAGFQVNEQIANALLPASECLKRLRDEFGPMAEDRGWGHTLLPRTVCRSDSRSEGTLHSIDFSFKYTKHDCRLWTIPHPVLVSQPSR